jgi:hypothetical protein
MIEELMTRAGAAIGASRSGRDAAASAAAAAARTRRRSQLLRAFVGLSRGDLQHRPRRCAWCGRIEVAGEFVRGDEFLAGAMPERLAGRSTDGICAECLARELGRTNGSG